MRAARPDRGLWGLIVAAAVALSAERALSQSAPPRLPLPAEPHSLAAFRVLDNVEGPWVNLGVVPIRPMVVTGGGIFAVNTHASTVVRTANFTDVESFPVPWGPVSIAVREIEGAEELLVVCRGSHVLARLNPGTGETLHLLDLPFEPADILFDAERDAAFIACSGADSVVEVDLASNAIVHTYAIRGKHPVFLSFDTHGRVLVAPQFSGNNSGTISRELTPLQADAAGLVDFATHPNVISGLPDEDLFAIDPETHTVTAVAKATGTVLFAHGVHPATGALWQINTEAKNKDPNRQTEASIRGFVVDNRLTIVTLPAPGAPGAPPAAAHTIINLDDVNPGASGVQYDSARSIGGPYGLAFAPTGQAAVCGLLTDNVVLLGPSGQRLAEIDLSSGSIPRGVAFDATGELLFVYSWGSNRIDAYDVSAPTAPVASVSLGFDPTPADVRAGRALYYSARFSLHNNASCNSCHIEGRTDMMHWNLSDAVRDDKGPMLTQTLASIQRNGPMHWRGERKSLADFNPAFDKLLGGTQLDTTPGGELDQFQAFVLSIQSPANPLEHPKRVVADQGGLAPPADSAVRRGSALRGQRAFFEGQQDVGRSCNECHMLPTGTSGDMSSTGKADPLPKRTHFKVPQFLEMWRKEQPIVQVNFADVGPVPYPLLGGALTHAGRMNSLFDFIDIVFRFLPAPDTADLLAFISQIDQGLAPAVHRCVHLNSATQPGAGERLTNYFLPQARERNIDIAVYGHVDLGQGALPMRWSWNRASDLFDAENSSFQSQPLAFFLNQATNADANFVFVGLPVGMGRPFGIDYDADEFANRDEITSGTQPYVRDSDGDGFGDGYETANHSDPKDAQVLPTDAVFPTVLNRRIVWVSARVAAIAFETDEPTSCEVEYANATGSAQTVRENSFQRSRRVLLTDLVPGSGPDVPSVYGGSIRVTDESGNTTDVPLPAFQAGDFFFEPTASGLPEDPFTVIVSELSLIEELRWVDPEISPSGVLQAKALARVDKKLTLPGRPSARDQVVIATLLVNGVRAQNFTTPLPNQFTVLKGPPAFPGPFVMSLPTEDDGLASLSFTLPGLARGDRVQLIIDAVATSNPATYDPRAPDFGDADNLIPLGRWSFPDTPAAARALTIVY
jgi:DNA-binding beta-propeller fold protein YncE